jgi:hypothetical protein
MICQELNAILKITQVDILEASVDEPIDEWCFVLTYSVVDICLAPLSLTNNSL